MSGVSCLAPLLSSSCPLERTAGPLLSWLAPRLSWLSLSCPLEHTTVPQEALLHPGGYLLFLCIMLSMFTVLLCTRVSYLLELSFSFSCPLERTTDQQDLLLLGSLLVTAFPHSMHLLSFLQVKLSIYLSGFHIFQMSCVSTV